MKVVLTIILNQTIIVKINLLAKSLQKKSTEKSLNIPRGEVPDKIYRRIPGIIPGKIIEEFLEEFQIAGFVALRLAAAVV